MKKIFIVLALITFSGSAFAQQDFPKDITVSWTNPSEYVPNPDGSPGGLIEAGDLESIRVEIYRQSDTVPVFTATVPDNGEGADQAELFLSAIPQPWRSLRL